MVVVVVVGGGGGGVIEDIPTEKVRDALGPITPFRSLQLIEKTIIKKLCC